MNAVEAGRALIEGRAAPQLQASPQAERAPAWSAELRQLSLVTLYLTERCNSRCKTCDYWRHGRTDMTLDSVRRLVPSLGRLGTRQVLISGGEPLLNPQWDAIAQLLRSHGMKLWLLTSGLALAKHARRTAELFTAITVSVDGARAQTYEAIRGLDAFDHVCTGIRTAVGLGARVTLRVTIQRANYREVPALIDLGRELGASQISFLAVDIANPHAFARTQSFDNDIALGPGDLPVFADILGTLERDYASEFESGFIAESPRRLRHLLDYFTAVCGRGQYPTVRCNAPEFSAVVSAQGRVSPCFFIPGTPAAVVHEDLERTLNIESMLRLRSSIRAGARAECERCVCSLWREPGELSDLISSHA
jgi:MoaA/NifB/PqqE/SkfB family radical SAM enzyme